jgi:hypothetical protein
MASIKADALSSAPNESRQMRSSEDTLHWRSIIEGSENDNSDWITLEARIGAKNGKDSPWRENPFQNSLSK